MLSEQKEQEQEHNKNHFKNIEELESKINILEPHATNLESQRDQELEHNKNHSKNIKLLEERGKTLERQLILEKNAVAEQYKQVSDLQKKRAVVESLLKSEKEHNKNHLQEIGGWKETASILDGALYDLTDKLRIETKKSTDLYDNVLRQQEHIVFVEGKEAKSVHDIQSLEGVLQRVHNKKSYRLVRWIKNTPRKVTGVFRRSPAKLGHDSQGTHAELEAPVRNGHDYGGWLEDHANVADDELRSLAPEISEWLDKPKIAILMPVYNPNKACLINAIESVLHQVYDNFEFCIADDASTESYVKDILIRYAEKDKRIKVVFREQNGHISAASNSALALVEADYVALMDHDDLLTPDALYWVAKSIVQNPDVELIYSDEDKMRLDGTRYGPYFKPDWNPELLMSHNFICHLGVYKTEKVKKLGGFDSTLDGAQDYDLALRYVVGLPKEKIVHIPRVLYHWRAIEGSTANGVHEKPYAEELIKKAAENALKRANRPAEVTFHEKLPGALRVRYLLPKKLPLVSIIIPTRNGFELLRQCVESILAKTSYSNFEIIIIDNGSDDLVAIRYLNQLNEDDRIRVIRDDSPFNYAALNNKAVALAKGELVALLNNDLEVINEDWLDEMVSHAVHPEVGAVGAKLYYPDNTIQHAGVIVGLGGVAGHSHKHFPRDNAGYCGRLFMAQNLSAVTAACLVIRKSVFEEVNGFDEKNLAVAFNDVDFCLRVQESGYFNVWTPYAELYHYESATRGYEDTPEKQARFTSEVMYMKERWGEGLLIDPAYSPNLTLDREDFSYAWPPRVR